MLIGFPADVDDDKTTADQWEVLYNYGVPCRSYLGKPRWMVPKQTVLGSISSVFYVNASHDPNVVIDYHWVANKYCKVAEVKMLKDVDSKELLCAFDNAYQARTKLMAAHSKWPEPGEDNVTATKSLGETPSNRDTSSDEDNVTATKSLRETPADPYTSSADNKVVGTGANPIEIDHTPLTGRRTRRVSTAKEPSQETGNASVEPDTVCNKCVRYVL